ncbi:TlpA disulfide reductase family protein [soil metagenome]
MKINRLSLGCVAASVMCASLLANPGMEPAKPTDTKPAAPAMEKAAKAGLAVGDSAPAYKVESFIKGKPIESLEKGKVYVVEFWATWCGPCVAAFPHLSEMQEKLGDKVTFIGTNIWERGYTDATEGKIKAFVEKQGDKMAYTVAYDGKSKAMDKAWMQAANQNGIPCAFIVNQEGKIAYIGHPMAMEKTLDEVVAGKFDITTAKAKAVKQKEIEGKLEGLGQKAGEFAQDDNWDGVIKTLDEMAAVDTDNKGRYMMSKFQLLMSKKNDSAAAYRMKDALLAEKSITSDGEMMNAIAWSIVDPQSEMAAKDKNLDFALTFATKANEATKSENPGILDTLARVYWEKGDKAKAIETQEKAVAMASKGKKTMANSADDLKATLETYKADAGKK